MRIKKLKNNNIKSKNKNAREYTEEKKKKTEEGHCLSQREINT